MCNEKSNIEYRSENVNAKMEVQGMELQGLANVAFNCIYHAEKLEGFESVVIAASDYLISAFSVIRNG